MYSGFFVLFLSNSLLSGNFPKKMQSGVRIHTVRIHTQRDRQRRIRPMCIAQLGVLIDNICLYITNRVCQKPWTSADVCVVRSKSHAFSLEFMFSKNDIYIYTRIYTSNIFQYQHSKEVNGTQIIPLTVPPTNISHPTKNFHPQKGQQMNFQMLDLT